MKRRRRLPTESPEMNLVPLLDMISLLVQVLLINAQFGAFAELASRAGTRPAEPTTEGLMLEVVIRADGYAVSWTEDGERIERPVACKGACDAPEKWDTRGLSQVLLQVKQRNPQDQQVVLRPAGGVSFDVIARTMDAARERDGEPLFPAIALADAP